MTSRGLVLASLVLGAAVMTTPAAAQQRDPRELEAKKACLGNRADRGIELLAELYAETNDPAYLYNQARCFQQNGRAQDAVTRFREYLRKSPNIDPSEKAQIQGYIAELEAQLRPMSAAPAPVVPPPPPVAPAPAASTTSTFPATPESSVTTGVTSSPAAASARDDRHILRIAGVATAAGGAVVLIGGMYMGLRAKQLSQDVTKDASNGNFSKSKYDDGRRSEILQWVGYGVGAAALVGGGVLYMLGTGRSGTEPASLAAMPAIGPGMAGGALRVVF